MWNTNLNEIEEEKNILICFINDKNQKDYTVVIKKHDFYITKEKEFFDYKILAFRYIPEFKNAKKIPAIEQMNLLEIAKIEKLMYKFLKHLELEPNFLLKKTRVRKAIDIKKMFIYLATEKLGLKHSRINVARVLKLKTHGTVLKHYMDLIDNKSTKFLVDEAERIYKNITI